MAYTSDDSLHHLLTEDDDGFHAPNERRWFIETCWFWFFEPTRRLGGWLYNWIRPNIGTCGGGLYLWDDSAWFHMDVPYSANFANLALPEVRDLRDFSYPTGASVQMLTPLTSYRLGYSDRGRVELDLRFDAVEPPWVAEADESGRPHHLDQFGRVSGTIELRGETIPIDCVAIRDRTWAVRSERWREGRVGYTTAWGDDRAFLVQSAAGTRGETAERVRAGYFVREGVRARVVGGSRVLERNREHGYLERIEMDVQDRLGRSFHAVGQPLSRMAMPIPGVHGVCWSSLIRWEIDGVAVWGDDQDAWAIPSWTGFRRAGMPADWQ